MTPLGKWLRRKVEKWAGTYYEGQKAPERLREQVIAFANMYPTATRGQFVEMAASLAEEAYAAGYLRGVEWAERDPEPFPGASPETIADEIDPDWKWRPAIQLEVPPGEVVLDHHDLPDVVRAQVEAVQLAARRFG